MLYFNENCLADVAGWVDCVTALTKARALGISGRWTVMPCLPFHPTISPNLPLLLETTAQYGIHMQMHSTGAPFMCSSVSKWIPRLFVAGMTVKNMFFFPPKASGPVRLTNVLCLQQRCHVAVCEFVRRTLGLGHRGHWGLCGGAPEFSGGSYRHPPILPEPPHL